jgi:hypothetical protein
MLFLILKVEEVIMGPTGVPDAHTRALGREKPDKHTSITSAGRRVALVKAWRAI